MVKCLIGLFVIEVLNLIKTVNEHPKEAARQGCPIIVTTTCNDKIVKSHDTPGGHIGSDDKLVDNTLSWYLKDDVDTCT